MNREINLKLEANSDSPEKKRIHDYLLETDSLLKSLRNEIGNPDMREFCRDLRDVIVHGSIILCRDEKGRCNLNYKEIRELTRSSI